MIVVIEAKPNTIAVAIAGEKKELYFAFCFIKNLKFSTKINHKINTKQIYFNN